MSYRTDARGNEVYDKDADGNEVPGLSRYAENRHGESFYPRDKDGNGYIDERHGLIRNSDGAPVLPLTTLGMPRYPKNLNGDDMYPDHKGRSVFGVGTDGHQYYAQTVVGDEYYPSDGTPATRSDGTFYYAKSRQWTTVFPFDEHGDEMYLGLVNESVRHSIPDRYAQKKDGSEYYPLKRTADGLLSECLLKAGLDWDYAKAMPKGWLYPKDAYGNEFYVPDVYSDGIARSLDTRVVHRYAVTNDLKVIVPTVGNTFAFHLWKEPILTPDDVLGELYREQGRWQGFVTRVTLPLTLSLVRKDYKYRRNGNHIVTVWARPFYKQWWFWVLVVLVVVAKLFIILWWIK